MLDRVLEPEVMDTPEEARDYDAMDHSAVNHLFAAEFLAVWDGEDPILDLGTGTAQIPIELCRQYTANPDLVIIAVDLADSMLELAQANVARAGLTKNILLVKGNARDLRTLDPREGVFGAVISNSIIHHIPDPSLCFAEMHRLCLRDGTLFVRDLLRPDDEPTLRHLVNTYAAGANDHQRKMFADSLRAALTLAEVRQIVMALGYGADTVKQSSDRHWTWSALRK